jgi:hypothetical protein
MRTLLPLLAAAMFSLTANAQAAASKSTHPHATMQQRFEQANVTHDGHLTLDQAKTGYKSVARHFDAIDQDKKGYITEDDIRAYYKTQRTLHHQATTSPHAPSS